jgi:hypothetical protein
MPFQEPMPLTLSRMGSLSSERGLEKLHDLLGAPEVGKMACQQRGALPGKRGRWLEFHGFAKLGLGAFSVTPPVRSQA